MSKKQLEMAEQQLVGFAHASAGHSIEQLAEAMGLTAREWDVLKDKVRLKPSDECDLDAHFQRGR